MSKLTGMFFLHDYGDTFHTGMIVAEVSPGQIILVQYDFMNEDNDPPPCPMELVNIGDMARRSEFPEWSLFPSRDALDPLARLAQHAGRERQGTSDRQTGESPMTKEKQTWQAMNKFAADQPLTEQEWQALSWLTLIDRSRGFAQGNMRWAETDAEHADNLAFYRSLGTLGRVH
jgi:hypothetical protein